MTKQGAIDSHQHFWDPAKGDYPWMAPDAMAPIRRIFGPEDLKPLTERAQIASTIVVQCRHDLEETRVMLRIADRTPFVVGVVGWVDLTSTEAARDIADLKAARGGAYLVGVRHIVHDEEDPKWLERPAVLNGLSKVIEAGLAFDLLLRPRDLPSAVRVAAAFPQGRFVLDHGAKPRIGDGACFDEEWADLVSRLAEHANVWCKLSGFVTEADWGAWRTSDIAPYVAHLAKCFGGRRLLFGSDWPVCTLAASYSRVKALFEETASRQGLDLSAILTENCIAAYRLERPAPD